MPWVNSDGLDARKYVCSYCDAVIASAHGMIRQIRNPYTDLPAWEYIYFCSHCGGPTYFDFKDQQVPSPLPGGTVQSLPDDLAALFNEARLAIGVGAHTGAVMICRKILMHVGVEKGAEQNKSFQYYVNYLDDKRYITPDSKPWVDAIRSMANDATHEIIIIDAVSSTLMLEFTEMLLKLVYEFPNKLRRPA